MKKQKTKQTNKQTNKWPFKHLGKTFFYPLSWTQLHFFPLGSSPPTLPSQQVTFSPFTKDTSGAGGWLVSTQQFFCIGLSSLWFSRLCLSRATGHTCSIMEHLLLWSWCSPCCSWHFSPFYSVCAAFYVLSQMSFLRVTTELADGLPWVHCGAGWKRLCPARGRPRPLPTEATPAAPPTLPCASNTKGNLHSDNRLKRKCFGV